MSNKKVERVRESIWFTTPGGELRASFENMDEAFIDDYIKRLEEKEGWVLSDRKRSVEETWTRKFFNSNDFSLIVIGFILGMVATSVLGVILTSLTIIE